MGRSTGFIMVGPSAATTAGAATTVAAAAAATLQTGCGGQHGLFDLVHDAMVAHGFSPCRPKEPAYHGQGRCEGRQPFAALTCARVVRVMPMRHHASPQPHAGRVGFAEPKHADADADHRRHVADLREIRGPAQLLQAEEHHEHQGRHHQLGDHQQRHAGKGARSMAPFRTKATATSGGRAARLVSDASRNGPAPLGQASVR